MTLLTKQVLHRNQKLEKYRQKKEIQEQTNVLRNVMKTEHIDDETKRNFYVNLLKLSIIDAEEELSSIDQEKKVLEFRKTHQEMILQDQRKKNFRETLPLKPIIITKDLAQKAVFGSSYPSLPTMTVNEFYDERVRQGLFPEPTSSHSTQNPKEHPMNESEESEDVDLEKKLEMDDEYEVARLRARDEYKDDHRRGEGNRFNRS